MPDDPATDFRPVILGGDITAYSLVRTFHEAYGVRPLVVNMMEGGPIGLSTLCDHLHVADLEDPATFVETLTRVGREHGGEGRPALLLVAAGDWYVERITQFREQLDPWFVIPYIDAELFEQVTTKDSFYALLDEVGVDHPGTVLADMSQDLGEEHDLPFGFPVVAKPAHSSDYYYAKFEGKKKVFVCDTPAELADALARVRASSYDGTMILQEFVPGDDTHMRVLTCYSDREGVVRFGSLGHVLLEEHHPLSIGNPCVIITTEADEVVDEAKRFLEHVGYVGFSNFDIKYDRRDGSYKFFELNARLGRSNFYVTAGGYNVAEWYVRDWVRHERLEGMTYARGEHLFTFVPKYVVKHYVLDPALRARALDLMRAGRSSDPNAYGPDLTLKRRAYNLAYHVNHVRKFRKHFVAR